MVGPQGFAPRSSADRADVLLLDDRPQTLLLTVNWSVATESNGSPSGNGFTGRVRNPALSPRLNLEPPRGVEPRSARYRRAALPLSYDGMAGRRVFETHTFRVPSA